MGESETARRSAKPNGPVIRLLRESRSWSQQELANRADLSKSTISNAEKGLEVDFGTLKAIAGALQVEPSELAHDLPEAVAPDSAERRGRIGRVWILAIVAVGLSVGLLVAARPSKPRPELLELLDGVWLTYNPTEFVPGATEESTRMPSIESIEADLTRIRETTRVEGIVSFGADGSTTRGLAAIPSVCKRLGLKSLMGVYIDPRRPANRDEQIRNALGEAGRAAGGFIVFYADNNSRTVASIKPLLERLRSTGKPAAVRLQASEYLADRELLELGDFLAMDLTPYWRDGSTPEKAAGVLENETRMVTRLRDEYSSGMFATADKPMFVGMISYPSGGQPGLTEEHQLQFFRTIIGDADDRFFVQRNVFGYYYDAFDPAAKPSGLRSDAEAHRGLFTHDRTPKPAVAVLARSEGAPASSRGDSGVAQADVGSNE